MARYLIRQATGGGTREIGDAALPFFLNQGYVIIDTLDDTSDTPPLYRSAAESDLLYAQVGDIGDDTTPTGSELSIFYEKKISRTGATVGQVPVLQSDGATLLFENPAAASVPAASETTAGKVELATSTETTTGTDTTRAVHPAGLAVALATKANTLVTTSQQSGTAYTLVIGDADKQIEMTNGSATTVTVPPNSSVGFSVGTSVTIRQYGAGQVTIAAGVGVTLRARGAALKTAGQYAALTLTKRATDEWFVEGDATT